MQLNPTQILRWSAIVVACIASLWVASSVAQADSIFPVFVAMGIGLMVFTCAFPAWLLVICIIFSLLPGRTGLGVGYWEILAMAVILRWFLIVPFRGGLFGTVHGKFTFVCIVGFTSILFFHGLPAFIGLADSAGRRLAVMAMASLGLGYLLLTGKLDTSKIPLLPWIGILPGIATASFDVINFAIPSALPITYFLYNEQNFELISRYQGLALSMVRLAGLRELGLGIAFLALTYFSRQRTFQPRPLITQILATLFGTLLTLLAGYRSYVAQIFLGTILAAYHRSKMTLFMVCLCGLIGFSTLLFIHSEIAELPLPMQRALSFLPGDWDWYTKAEAEGGFGWRDEIRRAYFRRIFPDSWLLGRGQVFDERTESMRWTLADPSLNIDYFMMMQSYHSGLVSSLDFVGVLGTIFLIAACIRAAWNCLIILRRRTDSKPWHFWIAIMFLTATPPFWYTGFFQNSFPFLVMAMCLLELARKELAERISITSFDSTPSADYELESAGRA